MFPPICVGCGCLGVQICAGCSQKMRVVEKDWCLSCGNSAPDTTTPCTYCEGRRETIPLTSLWYYESVVSRAIWSIKYKKNKKLIHEMLLYLHPISLAKILRIKERHTNAVFVPVPLHPRRERERGYNQSVYIAKLLSALTNIPTTEHIVERVRETPPQALCKSKTERLCNIQKAFQVKNPLLLKDKTIVLVDDVSTTGSTIREISREIHKHTRTSPLAICLAREKDSEKHHNV